MRISPKTCWIIVEVTDDDGQVGLGEATLQRHEAHVLQALADAAVLLRGRPLSEAILGSTGSTDSLSHSAAHCALDMAMWDLQARRLDQPLGRLFDATRSHLSVYANLNRGLNDRSPESFAAQARRAIDAGHCAIKVAPFDEVDIVGRWGVPMPATSAAVDAGLARIAAVREAVGPGIAVRVDCHWRFDHEWARTLVNELEESALDWLECPVPETDSNIPTIVDIRKAANRRGIRLAGAEDAIGLQQFMPFLASGAYDVIMPDVKYVGGLAEMCLVARESLRFGVEVSPHNPTGPIAHAASAQICSALEGFGSLEMQFDESPLFCSLLQGPPILVDGGRIAVSPLAGLGLVLNRATLASCTVDSRHWA